MSAQPSESISYPSDAGATLFLLTVRGRPSVASIDEARSTHNATAGAPPSVAGARSLGDLSHNVFSGLDDADGELLFIDLWNSLSGLGMFFGNPQVQESASQLFAEREGVVWGPTEGFGNVGLPLPRGASVKAVGILRTTVTSVEKAADAFRAYTAETLNVGRMHGLVSHSTWARVTGPGEEPSSEVIGVDLWTDVTKMNDFYALRLGYDHLGPVFAGAPATSVWQSAPGDWIEW
jgi:hypothetical protein